MKLAQHVNVIRGPPRPPYQSPRPRDEIGASHCAHLPTCWLRSAQLDILSRFASVRHPWRPALAIRSPVRRFQRELNTVPYSGNEEGGGSVSPAENRRDVCDWPGPPAGMRAEDASHRDVTTHPTRKPGTISRGNREAAIFMAGSRDC